MRIKQTKEYTENNKERGLLSDTYHNDFRRHCECIISFFVNLLLTPKLRTKPTDTEQALIDELRKNTSNFEFSSNGLQSEDEWMKHAKRTANMIQIDDPRRFLTWNAIKDTMGGSNYLFVIQELKYLKSLPNWKTKWKPAIIEDKFGQQPPFFLYPKSSGNLIHHAYVLATFENMTQKNIEDLDFIFDYGAGYGSVCRLAHRLGFKGKYLLYDISVFSNLQTYFLKSIGMKVIPFNNFLNVKNGICCISNIDLLTTYIQQTPNYNSQNALLMGMWSISESPLISRCSITNHISSFHNYLFGFQDMFGEVDNRKYFTKLCKDLPDVCWHYQRLKHLPGHNLLCGNIHNK